jgi:hypothetical protein
VAPVRRAAAAVALAVLLAACGGSGPDAPVSAPDPVPPPGAGGTPPDAAVAPGAGAPGGDPQIVVPRSGMADVRPRPWEWATPREGDERVVDITFWSGVEPCAVLERVDVDERDDAVVVTLFEGRDPGSARVPCPDLAVQKQVSVELSEPLGARQVLDGAGP